MLCAPIKEDSLSAIEEANQKADLIELRWDLFTPSSPEAMRKACHKPVIFKLKAYDEDLISLGPEWIDLPYGIAPSYFEKIPSQIKRICSYHDEYQTPNLVSLYDELKSYPADYYKIATYAESTLDALRMLAFLKGKKKCIGLCMGEKGAITRILAPVFGVPWTYAPLTEKLMTAPGQIRLDELEKTYFFRSLSSKTALYGLIGDPIDNSVGHLIHNFAFDQLGLDAVYVKMQVAKEEVPAFLPLCREVGFKGLSVTMPLKESLVEGEAINTVEFEGKVTHYWNTDGCGALNAVEKKIKVYAKRIVILGAGGAAISIAKEAKSRGAEVIIANRTYERAQKLASQIGVEAFPLNDFASKGYDILINCTPSNPISEEKLLPNRIVMDVISKPKWTPLLQAAKKKSCELIFGMDMFIEQAIGQYCHWFKRNLAGD